MTLVERLRHKPEHITAKWPYELFREAADTILNLEAENERLRTAITKIKTGYESQMKFCDIEPLPYFRRFVDQLRTALGDK